MKFIVFGIIYIVLFIVFNIYVLLDKKRMMQQYIVDNNIIKAKVVGNVIARVDDEEEHHAVLAYIINDVMYKKECMNGFGKKMHEVGDIVNIKYNEDNFEEIELLEQLEKMKMTVLERIIFVISLISGPIMFFLS